MIKNLNLKLLFKKKSKVNTCEVKLKGTEYMKFLRKYLNKNTFQNF